MPEFVAKRATRYRGKRLRDLCGEMHDFFRDAGVSELQKAQFAAKHLPEMAMTPREAARHLVRNNVDFVPLEELEGRIATTLEWAKLLNANDIKVLKGDAAFSAKLPDVDDGFTKEDFSDDKKAAAAQRIIAQRLAAARKEHPSGYLIREAPAEG